MKTNTSYYVYGNKIFIPSEQNAYVNNALDTEQQTAAELFKPSSYRDFGTDFTNLEIQNNHYKHLNFYFPRVLNQTIIYEIENV